jgi:AcrR family transcriptional regulator
MPKPTFFHLPDEKRNRIIEFALDEFSAHPYRQASLSRIVARAGIAKGSMYQYFHSKLDLYQWLVTEELERRRREWLQSNVTGITGITGNADTGAGLFGALERMVLTRVGFMLAHPRLARIAANAIEPTADEDLRELHGALRRAHVDDLIRRIREAQATGEVRSNVEARALAHFIDALVVRGTIHALLDRLGREASEFITAEDRRSLSEPEWRSLVQQALDLLHEGIGPVVTEVRPPSSATDPDPRQLSRAHVN